MLIILPGVLGLLVALLGLMVLKLPWPRRMFTRYILQARSTPAEDLVASIVTSLVASEMIFAGVFIALPSGLWLDVICAVGVIVSFFSFQYMYRRICNLAKSPVFQLRVLEMLRRQQHAVIAASEQARDTGVGPKARTFHDKVLHAIDVLKGFVEAGNTPTV